MPTLVLSLIGIGMCVTLVINAGISVLLASLQQIAGWVVVAICLEAVRMLAELWSMRAVLGPDATRVPRSVLFRSQLLCSVFSTVMPAGRTLGEAAKAASLSSVLPVCTAAAAGAAGQILTLIANGLLVLPGALLALGLRNGTGLALASIGYAASLLSLGGVLALAVRSPRVAAAFSGFRATRKWSAALLGVAAHCRKVPLFALLPLLLARAIQALQLALLASALGNLRAFAQAPVLQTIYMLGAAAGDLMPAQVGAIDAAFALAGPLLAMSRSSLVALGLAVHAAQLGGALLCSLAATALSRRVPRAARLASSPGRQAWET